MRNRKLLPLQYYKLEWGGRFKGRSGLERGPYVFCSACTAEAVYSIAPLGTIALFIHLVSEHHRQADHDLMSAQKLIMHGT